MVSDPATGLSSCDTVNGYNVVFLLHLCVQLGPGGVPGGEQGALSYPPVEATQDAVLRDKSLFLRALQKVRPAPPRVHKPSI